MSFGEPVGKMNFVLGSKSGRVVVLPGEEGMRIGKERRREDIEGPVCEVPWRNIRVFLWGREGRWIEGGGCAILRCGILVVV